MNPCCKSDGGGLLRFNVKDDDALTSGMELIV